MLQSMKKKLYTQEALDAVYKADLKKANNR